jgi:hypothetical protein
VFDDPDLVSHGGLVPVMALAERAGLPELLAEQVRPGGACGVSAHLKTGCLVAGMAAGADGLAARAIGTARACGGAGTIVVRTDSACYAAAVIAAVRRNGARFCVTAPATPAIRAAIAAIPQDARQAIEYPQAVWDDQLGCWISDAEVAGTPYTAFTSKKKALQVTARLIVRRVRDKGNAAPGQGGLFPARRCHAVVTGSPFELVQAEEQHRGHAIIEQVIADLSDGPLAHLPYPGSSPRTPPGSPSPRSPAISCAQPEPSPAAAMPGPGPPPSAAT